MKATCGLPLVISNSAVPTRFTASCESSGAPEGNRYFGRWRLPP